LNIGNNATNITIAPSAVYEVNNYISIGAGLQGSYVSFRDFKSYIYGGSIIGLINPIQQMQLSLELEQLRVNTSFTSSTLSIPDRNAWNTALFIGAGYTTNHVTMGARYNVLFKESDNVYSTAIMPFVRVYF
jgi:long-subunit fatty acid transport protein